jgi:hypothetical protein
VPNSGISNVDLPVVLTDTMKLMALDGKCAVVPIDVIGGDTWSQRYSSDSVVQTFRNR